MSEGHRNSNIAYGQILAASKPGETVNKVELLKPSRKWLILYTYLSMSAILNKNIDPLALQGKQHIFSVTSSQCLRQGTVISLYSFAFFFFFHFIIASFYWICSRYQILYLVLS